MGSGGDRSRNTVYCRDASQCGSLENDIVFAKGSQLNKIEILIFSVLCLMLNGCSMGFVPTGLTTLKQASEQCAGVYGDHSGFDVDSMKSGQQSDKPDLQKDGRPSAEWEKCMNMQGFRYRPYCSKDENLGGVSPCAAR